MNGGRGDHQPLVGADVGGRLGAPNVLLPRLQRERETLPAVQVEGAPDDAARHLPDQGLGAAEEAEVGPARGERRAEGLAFAAADVGARFTPLAGGFEHRHGDRVDHRDGERPVAVRPVALGVDVVDDAEVVGLGDDQGGDVLAVVRRQRTLGQPPGGGVEGQLDQIDALVVHDVLHHPAVGGVKASGNQDAPGLRPAVGPDGHQHRLGERRGAVVEGRVGDIHPHQRRHHRLVLVQQLQGPLAGLGLVGGVGAVELPARGDLPHRRGDVVVVGAGAEEADRLAILPGPFRHQRGQFHLGQRVGHAAQFAAAERGGNLVEDLVHAGDAYRLQHRLDLGFGVGNEGHVRSAWLSVRRLRPPRHRPRRPAGHPVPRGRSSARGISSRPRRRPG